MRDAAERMLEVVPRLMRLMAVEAQASGISGSLTVTQLRALSLLEAGQRLPSELARELKITPATASEIVDLLVRRGLVERGGHPEDRRLSLLRLTPAGSAQHEAARERALDALETVLTRLEPTDIAALERGLESLAGLLRERPATAGGGEHVD